jgi:quercetin dioxygenase-like cupin family protein
VARSAFDERDEVTVGIHARGLIVAAGILAMPCVAPSALAQEASAPITRTPLQVFDVPGSGYQTHMLAVAIKPGVNAGRHRHPGIEATYILEGDLVLLVEGQPERALKAGDSFQIPAGVPHDVRIGRNGAKLVSTYVVEAGKPLASPAP